MNIEEIKNKLNTEDYNFLNTNPYLNNIILLGMGGSYAYGTNIETSDIDIRGIATNSADEILLGTDFEQVVDVNTDTTIYSFNKMIDLLSKTNPNTIEILGLKPEHYLKITDIGQMLLDRKEIFLSKIVVHSFGGYAYSQLRRLDNKSARALNQTEKEHHILNSILNAEYSFANRYNDYDIDMFKLYIDKATNDELDNEIYIDFNLKHYPLRDYLGIENLFVYHYINEDNILFNRVAKNISMTEDGYLEFYVDHNSTFVIASHEVDSKYVSDSVDDLALNDSTLSSTSKDKNILMYCILACVLVVLIFIFIVKSKKKKNINKELN